MNNKISKKDLIKLAKKYTLNTSGTKTQIAKRLSDLRGIYLTQTERKLIMPLLNNLKTNPEKDYIYWPNRQEKVEQFETHIQGIYNG